METQSEQEKMDQLMAELQREAAAGEAVSAATEPETDTAGEAGEELSEQEKMDQLMAEFQGQAAQEAASAPEGEPDDMEERTRERNSPSRKNG